MIELVKKKEGKDCAKGDNAGYKHYSLTPSHTSPGFYGSAVQVL